MFCLYGDKRVHADGESDTSVRVSSLYYYFYDLLGLLFCLLYIFRTLFRINIGFDLIKLLRKRRCTRVLIIS